VKKIFVKSTNHVGDAVLVTPTLRVLRRFFPQAKITLLARPWAAGVFEANPDIDRLWVAEENKSKTHFRRIAQRMRQEQFDLGISLPNSLGAALLMTMGRVKQRVGYARDARRFLLTDPIQVTPQILQVHQVEYYLNLLRDFGDLDAHSCKLVVPVPDGANEALLRLLAEKGLAEHMATGKPLIGIAPGAAFGSAKRWLPDRFAAVSDHLAEKWDARTVIVGSKGERPIGETIAAAVKHPVTILCGDMPLRGLIALCDICRLFLCNDSGAMHVAAARETPLVAIFGSTNWITTAPYSAGAILLRKPGSCPEMPCMRRECNHARECMHAVTVEEVAVAADRQMESSQPNLTGSI